MPILFLAILVIVFDQISKYLIQSKMHLGMSTAVIPNVFHITYILNPGAAFGMLEHKTVFFVVVACIMLVVVFYYYYRIPPRYTVLRIGIALLAGGAIGNMIDRIRTGYVTDFLDFRIWPVFNIADMAIVGGVGLVIYAVLFMLRNEDEIL